MKLTKAEYLRKFKGIPHYWGRDKDSIIILQEDQNDNGITDTEKQPEIKEKNDKKGIQRTVKKQKRNAFNKNRRR